VTQAPQPRRAQADNLWYRHATGCRCDRCDRDRGRRAGWRASTWSLIGMAFSGAAIQLHDHFYDTGGILLMLGWR
jgi:hypothetical protein